MEMESVMLDAKTAQVFRLYQKIQGLDLELLSVDDETKKRTLIASRNVSQAAENCRTLLTEIL